VFEVASADVILKTNRSGDHDEDLEIGYRQCRLLFRNTRSDSCLKTSDVLKSLTAEKALPEDGTEERRNASEY